MRRLRRMTANRSPADIRQLRRDVDEMKASQAITAENVRLYLTTTATDTPGDDYGLQNVLAASGAGTSLFIRFTSTAPFHFADLTYKIFNDDGLELHPGDAIYPYVVNKQRLVADPAPYEKWWQLSIVGQNSTPDLLTFQFFVQSTSTGDFRL